MAWHPTDLRIEQQENCNHVPVQFCPGPGSVGGWPGRAASWADGMFDESSKDFGSVARGPALSHPFRVKNNTKGCQHLKCARVVRLHECLGCQNPSQAR